MNFAAPPAPTRRRLMATGKRVLSDYFFRAGYYVLVAAVGAAILFCVKQLLAPLLASVLLAFLLDPLVNAIETRGVKRFAAIIGIYAAFVLVASATALLAGPRLVAEAENLAANFPEYKTMIRDMLAKLADSIERRFPQVEVPDLFELVQTRLVGGGVDIDVVLASLSGFFSILSVVVIVPVVTFFLLADGHLIQKALLSVVPNRYFEMCVLLFHKIATALKLFIRGQMIDALAVGVMTSGGMLLIGMPYALVIGAVAGVGNLIPYLGPIIGFMPALFVLFVTPGLLTAGKLLTVAAVFAAVQALEGTFIYPLAVGKSSNLHPLVVIIGITVGGQVAGVLGMLTAIPVISIVKVTLQVLYTNLKSYSII
ncbi:MAG: AI-2E family transporter [Chitinivibrionales bacterium]|nr:AI-2E family transporter [Chitinivibrionales bacterium]MBD3356967.1 AI-2E family transporter [Chitinivibrionales bacterium]